MSVVDLSTLKDKRANNPEPESDADFEALDDQQKADLLRLAEENNTVPEEPAHQVRTAFLIVINKDGEIFPTSDLSLNIQRQYVPTADDIYGAAAVIQRDMTVQMASQHTVVGMQQYASAQQQRMQEAQIAAQLTKAGLKR